MDRRQLNHAYHRSRVDAHIAGGIGFILLILALAFTVGDKFRPFQQGAHMWEPTLLIWQPDSNAWIAASPTLSSDFRTDSNKVLITKEIYPLSYSGVVVFGSLVAAVFLYAAARRQTMLMLAVYDGDPEAPYQRPWSEVSVTFWALFVVMLGALFLFLL